MTSLLPSEVLSRKSFLSSRDPSPGVQRTSRRQAEPDLRLITLVRKFAVALLFWGGAAALVWKA